MKYLRPVSFNENRYQQTPGNLRRPANNDPKNLTRAERKALGNKHETWGTLSRLVQYRRQLQNTPDGVENGRIRTANNMSPFRTGPRIGPRAGTVADSIVPLTMDSLMETAREKSEKPRLGMIHIPPLPKPSRSISRPSTDERPSTGGRKVKPKPLIKEETNQDRINAAVAWAKANGLDSRPLSALSAYNAHLNKKDGGKRATRKKRYDPIPPHSGEGSGSTKSKQDDAGDDK